MKRISFSDTISKLQWGIFIAVMLFAACERSEYTTRITGTLYTDSTLTVPVANDTLWFYECTYRGNSQDSVLIRHALTD